MNAKISFATSVRLIGSNRFSSSCNHPSNSNGNVSPFVINRNPRNLELLRIAYKPTGYELDQKDVTYWNKLCWQSSKANCKGYVYHYTGKVLVSASTTEWCIYRHLYSRKDGTAALNIGHVLARRCLQAGITEVFPPFSEEEKKKSEKLRLFLSAMEEGGVTLNEYKRYRLADQYSSVIPQPPPAWEITEEQVDQLDALGDEALPALPVRGRGYGPKSFIAKRYWTFQDIRNAPPVHEQKS